MNDRAQKLYDTDTKISLAERLDFAYTTIERLDTKVAELNDSLGNALTDIETMDAETETLRKERDLLREALNCSRAEADRWRKISMDFHTGQLR